MSPSSLTVADHVDGKHDGPEVQLSGVGRLDDAGETELAFCVYEDSDRLRETGAGAVISPPEAGVVQDQTQIIVPNPRLGFALATQAFFADEPERPVHPSAVVHEDAEIGEETRIGPNAVVGEHVVVGADCVIRAGATIGCDGFGFERDDSDTPQRLEHSGVVRIEDGVEIGANSSVDRAVFDETVIGRNAKLSGQVHVAHNVTIGRNATVAYGAGFAGGATIGEGATIHPHVTIADDVDVGDGAEVGMNSTVLDDVLPNTTVVGTPARPIDGPGDDVGSGHSGGGASSR